MCIKSKVGHFNDGRGSQSRIIRTLSSLRMCSDLLFIFDIETVRIFISSGGFCYHKVKFALGLSADYKVKIEFMQIVIFV